MPHIGKYLICVTSTMAMSSCVKDLPHPQERVALPKSTPVTWKEVSRGYHGKISSGWLSDFQSPRMTKLVNEAITSNLSLKVSEARLRATWETTAVADADLKPSVSSGANTSRRRSGNLEDPATYSSSYGVSASASWEFDLWGRIRDRVSITQANYQADAHDLRSARLSLAANTAKAWCNLVTAEQQVELAQKTLKSFKYNNKVVERDYKSGAPGTRSLTFQLSLSNVASAQGNLRSRQLQRNNSARALELLLGRYPSAEVKSTTTLPSLRVSIPTGIPAQLLSRRPDVAAAEISVYISAKQADVARKSLLPSARFTAGLSSGSNSFRDIFSIHNLAANAAASLSQSIYNGGELEAAAKSTLERNKASIYAYANTVLRASREVEDAIATDKALREQEVFLVQQRKSAILAEVQAQRDFFSGIEGADYLEVIESQRRANNARISLINIRNRRLQNRIDLHLALGGDFSTKKP